MCEPFARKAENESAVDSLIYTNNNAPATVRLPCACPTISFRVIMWRMRLISGLFVRKELKSVPLHKAHRSPRAAAEATFPGHPPRRWYLSQKHCSLCTLKFVLVNCLKRYRRGPGQGKRPIAALTFLWQDHNLYLISGISDNLGHNEISDIHKLELLYKHVRG